ncbi:uncharacterized protein BO87DRAFT_60597 [Aspergillus neoniger CBS 115656]|uniref:Secreted protein n=1 Tax=Aspergillus neoniger (strain CBS 115656) TaxID=1448310 RepID=A0A318ZCQ7_ASPNB|nr:hypothetical protein BO87DRAFT_60597 [Aspergillus neoniger CBS 115656]PYH34022.1 hypothetical protein BO87DRAFT_60597 [Aspergillus neoniger CBS 115656]
MSANAPSAPLHFSFSFLFLPSRSLVLTLQSNPGSRASKQASKQFVPMPRLASPIHPSAMAKSPSQCCRKLDPVS